MSESAKWYVIHTYSGYENKVAQTIMKVVENRKLHDLINEIRVPTEKAIEITENNKEKEVERKIFPGYVLVKMIVTDDSWFVVRNVRGVTGFVGPAGSPVPLTEDEVAKLGVEQHSVEVTYAVGDTVEIVYGALEGFSGTVESVDTEKGIVSVTLSMLGRDTSVELELDQDELAD